MAWYLQWAIVLGTVVGMEAWAWWMHKYILHGPLWFLHRTHHEPQPGWWEWNDLVAVAYAVLSAGLVVWGDLHQHWLRQVGLGILLYGTLYFFVHDILVHQRIKWRNRLAWRYIRRIIRAHKMHHKHLQRQGSEAFGFLYAHKKYEV